MTEKSKRTARGREIRKATGLSLPVSMYLARHGTEALYPEKGASKTAQAAGEALDYDYTGCSCCQGGLEITGPKGSISAY